MPVPEINTDDFISAVTNKISGVIYDIRYKVALYIGWMPEGLRARQRSLGKGLFRKNR